MTTTAKAMDVLERVLPILRKLPEGTFFDIDQCGTVSVQARTQAEVRGIRAAVGGIWRKQYNEALLWWVYDTEHEGVSFHIYAVQEGPPSCRAIEEEVEVEKQVPTCWETKLVKEKRVRWECGDGAGD